MVSFQRMGGIRWIGARTRSSERYPGSGHIRPRLLGVRRPCGLRPCRPGVPRRRPARGERLLFIGERVIDSLRGGALPSAGIDALVAEGTLETQTLAEAREAAGDFLAENRLSYYEAAPGARSTPATAVSG